MFLKNTKKTYDDHSNWRALLSVYSNMNEEKWDHIWSWIFLIRWLWPKRCLHSSSLTLSRNACNDDLNPFHSLGDGDDLLIHNSMKNKMSNQLFISSRSRERERERGEEILCAQMNANDADWVTAILPLNLTCLIYAKGTAKYLLLDTGA